MNKKFLNLIVFVLLSITTLSFNSYAQKVYINDSSTYTIQPSSPKLFGLGVNITIQDNINHTFEGRVTTNFFRYDLQYVAGNGTGYLLELRFKGQTTNADLIQNVSCTNGQVNNIFTGSSSATEFDNFHNFTIFFEASTNTARIFIDRQEVASTTICSNFNNTSSINFTSGQSGEIKNNLILANNLPSQFIGNLPNLNWSEDTSTSFNISGNFSDVNGDALTFAVKEPVENISIAINSNTGIVNLTPSPNFNGIRYAIFLANDSENITFSNNVTLNVTPVNDLPNISNIMLNNTDFLNRTNGSLVTGWTFNDIDNDLENVSETLWYINGTENTAFRDLTIINQSNTTKTQNWTVSVRVSDGTGFSDFVNSTPLLIASSSPNVSDVQLSNTDFLNRTNGSLTASWTQLDLENRSISNLTRWYINGVQDSSLDNLTEVSEGNTTKGQIWAFSVQVFTATDSGSFVSSSNLTISNAVPTHSAPIINSSDGQNRRNGTLTCSNQSTSDLDNDAVTNFIRWFKNDVSVETAANYTLNVGNYSKNDNLTCEMTPFDGSVNGTALNSSIFTISNAAPLLNNSVQNKAWNENTITTINLNISFIDIDSDNLTYNFSNITSIAISIDNSTGIATLTPNSDFNGVRFIIFFASDGTNLTASNNVTLTVNDVPVSTPSSTSSGSSSGGSSGGGGGLAGGKYVCDLNWECSSWSECENGKEARSCKLVQVPIYLLEEKCPQHTTPEQSRNCEIPAIRESCSDKIQNQGETGIDCGGPCGPCFGFETEKETEIPAQNLITGAAVAEPKGFSANNLWLVLAALLALVLLLLYAKYGHKRLFKKDKLSDKEMKKLNEMLDYKMFKK